MEINNTEYGSFIVSKNVMHGKAIGYTYRQESEIPELNRWTIYSVADDNQFVKDHKNFVILNADTINTVSPMMLEIFDAPYGTDLCWKYDEKGQFAGFYDMNQRKETFIDDILKKKSKK